jgi:hypothetical protein
VATDPLHLLGGASVSFFRPFLAILFLLASMSACFSYGAVFCVANDSRSARCIALDKPTQEDAYASAQSLCQSTYGKPCVVRSTYSKQCIAIASPETGDWNNEGRGSSIAEAEASALAGCERSRPNAICKITLNACDKSDPKPIVDKSDPKPIVVQAVNKKTQDEPSWDFLSDPTFYRMLLISRLFQNIWQGIGLGLGILIVIIIYAKRAAIINFIVHGNLPYKLAVYGEDIQCIFKRTQRLNWYGRIIFGVVANLSMTQDQLGDVRKYWLGRVVAFDSLRRRRQNQLALLHLQQVSKLQTKSKGETVWRIVLACLRWIILAVFHLLRALFSFLFGFLFIRVTIAKLVRGTIIESKDLVLVMESKDAIEQSAEYLKEYLETANTFDGRDEVV